MMTFWTVYDPATGEIVSCFGTSEPDNVANNVPVGLEVIEGQSDPQRQIVVGETVVDKPQDVLDQIEADLAFAQARNSAISERNRRLFSSDWTQVPDAPVDQAAWQVYRQALRDITLQEGFPTNIIWPQPPQ